MTGPGPRAELSPEELDLLEDALADLDHPFTASERRDELPAHLRQRLDEYASILTLTRDALPLVEVPDGLLDAVIAEAQRSPAVQPEVTARPGLWERLRRSFVLPGFALAATAALLVVVLRPSDDAARLDEAPAASEAKAARSGAAAEDAKDMSEGAGLPAAAAPAATQLDEPAAPEEAADAEEEAPIERPAEAAVAPAPAPPPLSKKEKVAPVKRPGASKSAGGGLDGILDDTNAKASEPAPLPLDASDKDALRGLLSAADKARYGGRCGDATGTYKQLRGVGGMEEARALVGLGLCAEANGDAKRAGEYFAQARALAPAIDSVIASERQKMGASRKKASKIDFE